MASFLSALCLGGIARRTLLPAFRRSTVFGTNGTRRIGITLITFFTLSLRARRSSRTAQRTRAAHSTLGRTLIGCIAGIAVSRIGRRSLGILLGRRAAIG